MSKFYQKKKRRKRLRIAFLVLLVLGVVAYYFGNRFAISKGYDGLWSLITTSSANYSGSIPADMVMEIKIKQDHFTKLEKVREDALKRGVIIQPEDPYVPCKIHFNGEKIKAGIRLKGKMTDHVKGKKWSFRVKTKKGEAVMGMKRFTLQHPGTRSYIHEWIFHEMMEREGILKLKYHFLQLKLNGEDLGIYALEEHFGQELLTHNQQVSGPIFRFNPSLYWHHRLNRLNKVRIVEEYTKFQNSQIETFTQGKIMKDSAGKQHFRNAVLTMEAFRRGEAPAKAVLDVEKFALRHAILDLIGGYHSVDWSDVKFYYNPETMKIEPVAYESFSARKVKRLIGHYRFTGKEEYTEDFHEVLFNDPDFFKAYMRNLDRISKETYLDAFFADKDSALHHNLAVLYAEFPYKDFSKEVYYYNAGIIRKSLDSPQAIHVHYAGKTDSTVHLQVASIESLPCVLTGLEVNGTVTKFPEEKIIPAKGEMAYANYISIALPVAFPDSVWDEQALKIRYSLLGLEQERSAEIMPAAWEPLEDYTFFLYQEGNLATFPWLQINEKAKTATLPEGRWKLDHDLVIPENWVLQGTGKIDLLVGPSVRIVSRGAIRLTGTEDLPVQVVATAPTAQGIVILNDKAGSTFNHVQFKGFGTPAEGMLAHNSALTFYETTVTLKNCLFTKLRGNKAIEATRSEIRFLQSAILDAENDGMRLNFCDTRIREAVFSGVADQALIVNGGLVRGQKVRFLNVRDEALLARNYAQVNLSQVNFHTGGTAAVAKDGATITLNNTSLDGMKKGFRSFRKGKITDPSSIELKGLTSDATEQLFEVEPPSVILKDGIPVAAEKKKSK